MTREEAIQAIEKATTPEEVIAAIEAYGGRIPAECREKVERLLPPEHEIRRAWKDPPD